AGLSASSVCPPAIQKAVVAQRATKTQYPNPGQSLAGRVSDRNLREASGFCEMTEERSFGRGETGRMVSNSASSTAPSSETNQGAGIFPREDARDICAVDGCFAIMTSSSFAFFAPSADATHWLIMVNAFWLQLRTFTFFEYT